MARVFVTRQLPGPALKRLAEQHDVTVWMKPCPVPRAELLKRAATADGLLTMLSDRIDEELLGAAPNLKVIANYAVGFDNFDVPAAVRHKVKLGNTPDVLTDATADLAWALLMAVARHLPQAVDNARKGGWRTWDPTGFIGADVHGKTLGVIGNGRIGQAVARRAAGFEMNVITTNSKATPRQIDELLETADFVSLHCPLTPQTHHLLNAATLALMKPTAILINTARGGIVDQDALAEALNSHTIGGAGLDVTDPEPLLPDHPLYSTPNTIIVPHIGSATHTARNRMTELAVANLLAGLAAEPLPHPVPGS